MLPIFVQPCSVIFLFSSNPLIQSSSVTVMLHWFITPVSQLNLALFNLYYIPTSQCINLTLLKCCCNSFHQFPSRNTESVIMLIISCALCLLVLSFRTTLCCLNRFCLLLQADVFSFGIFMYMVLTGGQHPFEDLDFKSERDKAFADVKYFIISFISLGNGSNIFYQIVSKSFLDATYAVKRLH